ncbi:7-methylguanosine phosphate-specific 5'-nucleotidase [Contarinia nasturtii]|uniref:7-methylguanosine phosphate-specific 5'-nucleotidase n=1 Tax=Contarinia nasturtii TaxID=265458 RepID=UPI0012D4B3E9|nr:7-methylguanosine phosphate-specific 5'-nucleotidase [Contarinia nasturtii]XP_031640910.1 7-methylguanosine phosphate-specific 5'-nucleotidase [Contarinia nasturtii]XP_031640911.1 7-methylguanosine phosphate-specific 5'-nucleotidase [Contarinia nasturtii]
MTTKPQQFFRLCEIDVLTRSNCKIKDPEHVLKIINNIISGGNKELQIVTDFDFTLTKQKTHDEKPVLSSFGMFRKCKSLPTSFLEDTKKLYEIYRPIEICPKITQNEKRKHMIDWWVQSRDLLKGFPFDSTEIEQLAKEYGHVLRDGTHDIFSLSEEMNVPILVFSAGLGDSIRAILRHEQIFFPNVKLVSNFLKYDNGLLNGFSDDYPLIHTFNKNETVLEGTEYYDMVHNRKNVILMGFVMIPFRLITLCVTKNLTDMKDTISA